MLRGLTFNHKKKLSVSDYLCDLPYEREAEESMWRYNLRIHVRGITLNSLDLELYRGDMVSGGYPRVIMWEVTSRVLCKEADGQGTL